MHIRCHWIAGVAAAILLPVWLPAMAGPADVPRRSLMRLGKPQSYAPADGNTATLLGTMRFGATFASFSLLHGHMDISHRGDMPDPEGLGTGKMWMHRVTNAKQFWNSNKGKTDFCPKMVEWLGATQMLDNSFRISFFSVGGTKGSLDERVTFRDHEEGGLEPCSADTFTFDGAGVKSITTSGGENFQTARIRPMPGSDLRKFMVGAWRIPDGNFDKLPEQKLRLVQVFKRNGTGVVLPWENGICGSDPLRRFSWSIKGDKILVAKVKPKGDLLIGSEPIWVSPSSDGFGYFNGKDELFKLAYVPQCSIP